MNKVGQGRGRNSVAATDSPHHIIDNNNLRHIGNACTFAPPSLLRALLLPTLVVHCTNGRRKMRHSAVPSANIVLFC